MTEMTSRDGIPVLVGPTRSRRRAAIAAATFGNMVEWYDWVSYGLLAPVFGVLFFPTASPTAALLFTLVTFAVGFLVRPLGGILLAPLGDRLGRRTAMSITVLLMGAGCLLIAIAPTYHVIGIAAPVLLVVARCVQGLSAGAEFAVSSVFIVEHAAPNRRGLVGSLQNGSVGLGTLLGSGVASAVTGLLPEAAATAWGWRAAFAFGAVLSLFGLFLRLRVEETAEFTAVKQMKAVARTPLLTLLRTHPRASVRIVGMSMGATITYYLFTVFLPSYGHLVGGLPLSATLSINAVTLALFVLVMPIAGLLADTVTGRRPLMVAEAAGFVLLAYPLLYLAGSGNLVAYATASAVAAVLLALMEANLPAVYCEQFPVRLRATGIGVPYAISAALFGGTAPLVSDLFIHLGQPLHLAAYVMATQLVTGLVYLGIKETSPRQRRRQAS